MQGGHNKVIDLKTETKMIFIMEISPIHILWPWGRLYDRAV